MIRFLEILNSLGINTKEDAKRYADSIFSEIEKISSDDGNTQNLGSLENFEYTANAEFTAKVPLITFSPEYFRKDALQQKGLIDLVSGSKANILMDKNASLECINSVLHLEKVIDGLYDVISKETEAKELYENMLNFISSVSLKLNSLDNVNQDLANRVSLASQKISGFSADDLRNIEATKRYLKNRNTRVTLESEDYLNFRLSNGIILKIKLVIFNNQSDGFSLVEYGASSSLKYNRYEEALKEGFGGSYDIESVLSLIGFSSIEELNSAMNRLSKLRGPARSLSDDGAKRGPWDDRVSKDSPVKIVNRFFGGRSNIELHYPDDIFRYPLYIGPELTSGLKKSEQAINISLGDSVYLFEEDGEHQEFLSKDIARTSLESFDQSTSSTHLSHSNLFQVALKSESIHSQAIEFAKKYIQIFEELFSKRCDEMISSKFSAYRSMFEKNQILEVEIDALESLDNNYEYIKRELEDLISLESFQGKLFEDYYEEKRVTSYRQEQRASEHLPSAIASYKYAKYLISSNDTTRIASFLFAVISSEKESGADFFVVESDFFKVMEKEIKEFLANSSEENKINLDLIIEGIILKYLSKDLAKIIPITYRNLETVFDNIKDDYIAKLFFTKHNFAKSTNLGPASSASRFDPTPYELNSSLKPGYNLYGYKRERHSGFKLSSPTDTMLGLSEVNMFNYADGATSAAIQSFFDASEGSSERLKLDYLLNRKKVFSKSGYREITKGGFDHSNSSFTSFIKSKRTVNAFIDLIISKEKSINDNDFHEIKNNTEKFRSFVFETIDDINKNKYYFIQIGLSLFDSADAKTIEGYKSGFDSEAIDAKDLSPKLLALDSPLIETSDFPRGLVLTVGDMLSLIADNRSDFAGNLKGSRLIPEVSFDDGKASVVTAEFLRYIDDNDSEIIWNENYHFSPSGDKKDSLLLENIIFAAEHASEEAGSHGRKNLSNFMKIYEDIIKEILIAEEKFISSKELKSPLQFIKNEKLKYFIDFICKSQSPDKVREILSGGSKAGAYISIPLSVSFYEYINKLLNDNITSSSLLFHSKHVYNNISNFIDNVTSVVSHRDSFGFEDAGFSVFCCNLMYGSKETLSKKVKTAEKAFGIFHSDFSEYDVNASKSGISNFILKNNDFLSNANNSNEYFYLKSSSKNTGYAQSEEFVENANKSIYLKLIKSFYRMRSAIITDTEKSFDYNLKLFFKKVYSGLANGSISESLAKESLLFDVKDEDCLKIIQELSKYDSDFNFIIANMNKKKFLDIGEFIKSTKYSEENAFSQNEDIYLIIRSMDYVSEVTTKTSAYLKYFQIAEKKNEKLFDLDYNFTYKGASFGFKVLRDLDPYHFQVGKDTNCCQVLGGVGTPAAVDSFVNSEAGVIVLYSGSMFSRENLLAQSYFHIVEKDSEEDSFFILDNIEISLANCYKINSVMNENQDEYMPTMYAALANHITSKGYGDTLLGKGYTKISIDRFAGGSITDDPRRFTQKYSDFHTSDHKNISKFDGDTSSIISLGKEEGDEDYASSEKKELSFSLESINILNSEYFDYSKKKPLLKKSIGELTDKSSDVYKELKAQCKAHKLNFQKIRKFKINFFKKMLINLEKKEEVNKDLLDKISKIKEYVRKSPSGQSIEDLAICLKKYKENEWALDHALENADSTVDWIDENLNGVRPSVSHKFYQYFEELSNYKKQCYLLSKTNLFYKYIILNSKDFIKKEYEKVTMRKRFFVEKIKEEMLDINFSYKLSAATGEESKIEDFNILNSKRISHLFSRNIVNNPKRLDRMLSPLKDKYPNSIKIIKGSFGENFDFLFKDMGVDLKDLESELKNMSPEDIGKTHLAAIGKYKEFMGILVSFYFIKKYLPEAKKASYPKSIYCSLENLDSFGASLLEATNLNNADMKTESLNDFVLSSKDIDPEDILKNAKNPNNQKIIRLASWLMKNNFNNKFSELNKLNWSL